MKKTLKNNNNVPLKTSENFNYCGKLTYYCHFPKKINPKSMLSRQPVRLQKS